MKVDVLLAEKPGDLVRDQSEPWAAVGRPWGIKLRDLVSSLALFLIGGAFPKCKCSVENKKTLFVDSPGDMA